jgi:hypothetical protein
MKRIASIIAGLAACSVALAAEPIRSTLVTVNQGTNLTGSAATTSTYGYIEEIAFTLPTGTTPTGVVSVVATQPSGATVTLLSKVISATGTYRPALDRTGTDGAALTSDPPTRYLTWSDSIAVSVTDASETGLVWKVYIKACDK